ncbi:tyrosine-protein phosphatase 10D, partial [Elysia marginata]
MKQNSPFLTAASLSDPESVAALQKVESLTTSITVNWTAPTSINIDYFQLGIQPVDPATKPIPRPMNVAKNQTSTTFEGLEPGLEYTIAIRTAKLVSSNRAQFGESVKLRAVTKPLPVEELIVETLNTTAVSLRWDTNNTSRQNRFRITYTADETSRSLTVPARNESGQSYGMEVGQLLPGYSYSISVVAIRAIETDLAESDEGSSIGYTDPSPVGNLTLTHEGTDLLIAWSPPASGRWNSYKVQYRPILRDNETVSLLRTSKQDQNNMHIADLFPGEKYEVEVVSISNGLESNLRESNLVFSPLAPTDFNHSQDLTTTTGLTLRWTYNMESTYTERWSVAITAGQFRDVKTVEASEMQLRYSLALTSLEPGETYTVSISAIVMDKRSELETLQVTTKPVITSILTPKPSTNSSVSLSYTVTESDIFDHLMFTLGEDVVSDPILKTKEDLKRSIVFDGLEAGTKYTVRAFTVSKGEKSVPKSLDLITDPNPVPVTFSSDPTRIVLTLGPQVGQAAEYIISCSFVEAGSSNSEECGERTVSASAGDLETRFENLRPYQKYSFQVVTRTLMLRGEQKQVSRSYEHTTDEAAPSVVRSLTVQALGIHSVSLRWQPPERANGRLRSYILSYVGSEPTDIKDRDFKIINNIPVSDTSKTIDNLRAGFFYQFAVHAMTVAQGEGAKQNITMGTTAPAFRPGQSAVKSKPALLDSSTGGVSAVTESKISLTFTNPFSYENGIIRYYTVIVSKDASDAGSSARLPSWADAQADSSIQVYQTVDKCKDFFSGGSTCGKGGGNKQGRRRRSANSLDSRTFIVGEETDCTGKTFCNGPLSPDTDYYVKLRGFTASGQFEETEYSEKIHTAKKSSSNTGMAAGIGSTVAVLAGVGVVMGVIVMRRRRRPKRATKHVGPKAVWEQSTMCKFSRPVKLSDFPAHVRKMAADSDFKYAEEYEDLKEVGRDQPCLAAEFPPNRPKNRFTNILPYDHSRVKLLPTDDDEGSDYINANYMPGFNSKREYIATQGPLPATRDDFWRMVWEQSSRNIVMLTRCYEKGREKSDHYWPSDSDPKFYGDLHLVILNETHMPDWTVTELRLSLGEQSRNIRHFHYKIWPDFGVPKDRTSLIRFVRMVRERLVREGGPIVTHCSAGVGRSGTFIVLDHLLQMIREKDEVDVFSIVYKLRKERVLMVQTELQYKFIHECLLCVLEGKEDDTTYANVGQINVGFD